MTSILKKKLNKKGFTLAELLIVVAIIGVLIAIAIPVFGTQLDNAKKAVDSANGRSLAAEYIAYVLSDNVTSNDAIPADGTEFSAPSDSGITPYSFQYSGYTKWVWKGGSVIPSSAS